MFPKKRRLITWFITMFFLLTQAIFAAPVFAQDTGTSRLSGADRYKTAVAVSQKGWSKADYAVLARGDNFADALCAGPLAQKFGGPILLTESQELNSDTLKEIKRLGVKHLFIAGGTGAIAQKVEDNLKAEGITNIERIYGENRYETSVKIAEKIGNSGKVVLATGSDFPDALSISAIASKLGMPILLTSKSSMTDVVTGYFKANTITQTYIVGGTGIISAEVESTIPGPTRLAGKDRYETNLSILKYFEESFDFENIYVAIGGGPQGNEFADALTGAVLAAKSSSPLLLANKTLTSSTEDYLKSKIQLGTKVTGLGGQALIPSNLLSEILGYKEQIAVAEKYNVAGIYGPESGTDTIQGNVMISTRDVTLRNTLIEGDLLLARSIGDGDVTLSGVTVKGKTIINGGGPNSIIMYNFNGVTVIVDVPEGSNVRLVAQGNTSITNVTMDSNGRLEEENLTGSGFVNVAIPSGAQVTLDGTFSEVSVEAAGANVSVAGGAIATLTVAQGASGAGINLAVGTSVTVLNANAQSSITGQGQIATANVYSNYVTIEKTPAATNVAAGVTATVGGATQTGTTTTIPVTPPAGGGGSGGGGGGNSDTLAPTFNPETGAVLSADHKIVTLSFSENILNNKANLTALKAEITLATDGVSFSALGAEDNVAITSGKLVLTFQNPLVWPNNKIRVHGNALKDAAGNIKTDATETSTINASYEPDDEYTQATLISTDGIAQTHRIDPVTDTDWVKFQAVSGQAYLIRTANLLPADERDEEYSMDTYIYLHDNTGQAVLDQEGNPLSNDDDANSLASRIVWTPSESGTYYVRIVHYENNDERIAEMDPGDEMDLLNIGQYDIAISTSFVTATPITDADINISKGSIDFAYSFAAETGPVPFAEAKAAPYYLDETESFVQLGSESENTMSEQIPLSSLLSGAEGSVIYQDLSEMASAFADFQAIPTHFRLYLVSKNEMAGTLISDSWSYDSGWTSFELSEMGVFALYGDKQALVLKDSNQAPLEGLALQNITGNLTLDTTGAVGGSAITWESNNPDIITNDGMVSRPAMGTGNATVTLTATLAKGAVTETKAFTLTVLAETNDPNIAKVAADKAALVESSIKGANPDLSNITGALAALPAVGSVNGSAITWVSGTPGVVSHDGQTVVRPAFGAGNAIVTLTATLTKGAVTETKAFTLTVLAEPDTSPPIFESAVLEGSTITLEFDKNIVNNTASGDALKAAITFAEDGSAYHALEAGDMVEISEATLTVTLITPPTGEKNRIRVAGGSLKDENNNIMAAVITTSSLKDNDRYTQLTNNALADGSVDAAKDSSGNLHVVYVRSGNIHYKKFDVLTDSWTLESLVAAGSNPEVVTDNAGNPHVAYLSAGVKYKTLQDGVWGEAVAICNAGSFDMDIDGSNVVHFTYLADFYEDGYSDIVHTSYSSGNLVTEGFLNGEFVSLGGADAIYTYYFSPMIKANSDGSYRIAYKLKSGNKWSNGNDWSTYIGIKGSGSPDAVTSEGIYKGEYGELQKDALTVDSSGNAQIVYCRAGNVYSASVGGTWTEQVVGAGANPTLDIGNGNGIGIAYLNSGNIYYAEKDGGSYNIRTNLDTSGETPVAVVSDKNLVFYSRDNEIHLIASDGSPNTVTATPITDADISISQGSIDFSYSFNVDAAAVTYAEVKESPYYLDEQESWVQLKTESMGPSLVSSEIPLSTIMIGDNGSVVYEDFSDMAEAFADFQNPPTHIRLHLASKTDVDGCAVDNPWVYDTDWISFDPSENDVFTLYGDMQMLMVRDTQGDPINDLGLQNITGNLTLETTGWIGASAITWESSLPSVVANDGTVTRPAMGMGNAVVTLTATISSGAVNDTKQFIVTVLASEEENPQVDAVNSASAEEMGAVITLYAEALGLNLTDYNFLADRSSVYAALTGKDFPDSNAVKTAFDTAVAIQKAVEAQP